jgi:hypothetical protein
MTDECDPGRPPDTIVPFPSPVSMAIPQEARLSAVESASLAETTRRKEIARIVEVQLSVKTAMNFTDRFALARNVRDYVYGLQAAGRLSVRQVGARAFNREEVRALQQYVLPNGVETQSEYKARHSRRALAGKPFRYLAIMLAAAEIAGDDRNVALLQLAQGTRFWPGTEHAADGERRAANEIVELLCRIPAYLDAISPLDRYFDLVERQRILPLARESGIVFDSVEEYSWWEHEAIPAVRLARRWLRQNSVPVMVAVSQIPATGERVRVDFDALYRAGQSFESWVGRRQIFSLGIGRISGDVGPVAIFSHEVVLPDGHGYRVTKRWPVDRLSPGWNLCTVDRGEGPVVAAWQVKEALDEPLDPNEQDYDEPPDIRIEPITADWLLERNEEGWLIAKTTSLNAGMWRVLTEMERGRIGSADALPSIVERCMKAQTSEIGPVTEIASRYKALIQSLKEWEVLLNERAQRKLGDVAEFLAKGPD